MRPATFPLPAGPEPQGGVGMSVDPRRHLACGDVVRIEIQTPGAVEHAVA